jgi:hypothetical protein
MTDPLRPFADLIRSLSQSRTRGVERASRPSATASVTPQRTERTLKSRIKERIAQAGSANPSRRRELFVEAVLLAELGENLAQDPAFGEMVSRVTQHLHSDSVTGVRLDELLTHLSDS